MNDAGRIVHCCLFIVSCCCFAILHFAGMTEEICVCSRCAISTKLHCQREEDYDTSVPRICACLYSSLWQTCWHRRGKIPFWL